MKFKQDVKTFLKSKTNWTGLGLIIGGALAFHYKNLSEFEAGQMIVAGFSIIFLRDGIEGAKNAQST